MKTKIENLSFIVLISFQFGIGTDKTYSDVFIYCNGIESFKQLAEYGMGKFIVTYCWSFF